MRFRGAREVSFARAVTSASISAWVGWFTWVVCSTELSGGRSCFLGLRIFVIIVYPFRLVFVAFSAKNADTWLIFVEIRVVSCIGGRGNPSPTNCRAFDLLATAQHPLTTMLFREIVTICVCNFYNKNADMWLIFYKMFVGVLVVICWNRSIRHSIRQ